VPKRTRSHILEDESKAALGASIPSNWVIRYQNPDYGLDALVQIFQKEMATPYYFFVQLKGSDIIELENNKPSYSFTTEHLNYYFSHFIPVMLVLYDSNNNRLFFQWAHDIPQHLNSADRNKLKNQKTFAISFRDRLDEKFVFLEKEVKNQISKFFNTEDESGILNIGLDLGINKQEGKILHKNITEWMNQNSFDQSVNVSTRKTSEFFIKIRTNPLTLQVDHKIFKIPKFKFANFKDLNTKRNNLFSSVILTIAFLLILKNKPNKGLNIVSKYILNEKDISLTGLSILTGPHWPITFSETKRSEEAYDIAKKFGSLGHFGHGVLFSSTYALRTENKKYYSGKYIKLIRYFLSKAKNNLERGRLHYTLGNSLRGVNLKKAIIEYNQAAKHDPEYKKRFYWWRELGGCYFCLKDFDSARRCYKSAIKIDDKNPFIFGLLGDTFFHQGKFFFEFSKERYPEFGLKCWISGFFYRKFGDTKRNTKLSNRRIKEASKKDNQIEVQDLLFDAIKADPLNSLTWEKYVSKEWPDVQEVRTYMWLIIAILNGKDALAWANALILYTFDLLDEPLDSPLFCQMILEAFRLNGETLKPEIKRILDEQPISRGVLGRNISETLEVACESLLDRNPIYREPEYTYRFY